MLALPHALPPLSCSAVEAQGIVSIYVDCGPLVLVVARGRLELRAWWRTRISSAHFTGRLLRPLSLAGGTDEGSKGLADTPVLYRLYTTGARNSESLRYRPR